MGYICLFKFHFSSNSHVFVLYFIKVLTCTGLEFFLKIFLSKKKKKFLSSESLRSTGLKIDLRCLRPFIQLLFKYFLFSLKKKMTCFLCFTMIRYPGHF